jgi:hypothetical protein
MPTTTTGITAAMSSLNSQARLDPNSAPMHSAAIQICVKNPYFTATHMRTSGAQTTATAIPAPALSILTNVIADLLSRDCTARGTVLRDATQEVFLLFPTLVSGPRRHGASSSSVKSEVDAKLDLWRKCHIDELAICAKAQARARPTSTRSKTTRATKRAARLVYKNQCARALNLATTWASRRPLFIR